MGDNNTWVGVVPTQRHTMSYRVIIVEVLITVFLCINLLQIATFLKKELFRTTMRYILFANTLLSDSLFLILTNIVLILVYFRIVIDMWLCLIIYIGWSLYTFVTQVTLTAMTLERYVAICMPLRHGELCTTRNSLHCILIIHSISSIPLSVFLSIFFASATQNAYTQRILCTVEILILHSWQQHLRSAINQLYFLIICSIIVFCYVNIMKVAKVASGENQTSTKKGLQTVALHGFQLMLCLISLWSPFIEAAFPQNNFILLMNVKFFNYIVFILTPRCLSPLIYGLRDEKFFLAVKSIVCFSLEKKKSSFSFV
ncbi:odorant receptor 131-2-like [Genypterus blacodes]|uniref:odorant receptor 131-2-like n=1 Tax=Genypterus blacodes TaxID=154954 RepID=UPI003F772A74